MDPSEPPTLADLYQTEPDGSRINGVFGRMLLLPGILELYGEAGTGKSQICFEVLASYLSDNPERAALYVSVDFFFNPDRFFKFLKSRFTNDPEEIGNRLVIYHITDGESLQHFVAYFLPNLVQNYDVGVTIIDSLASAFRLVEPAYQKSLLFDLSMSLRKVSLESKCFTICINQVSATVNDSPPNLVQSLENCPTKEVHPALGLSWSSCVDHRFSLERLPSGLRRMTCTRSPLISPENAVVEFEIRDDSLHVVT